MKKTIIFFSILFVLISFMPNIISDDDLNSISIQPATSFVGLNESFSIAVFCVPTQPVCAFELSVKFNASFIHAT